MTGHQLSVVAWAVTRLGSSPPPVAAEQQGSRAPSGGGIHTQNQSHPRSVYWPDAYWRGAALAASQPALPTLSPPQLSNLLWAVGKWAATAGDGADGVRRDGFVGPAVAGAAGIGGAAMGRVSYAYPGRRRGGVEGLVAWEAVDGAAVAGFDSVMESYGTPSEWCTAVCPGAEA
jgi:hypothetical protein